MKKRYSFLIEPDVLDRLESIAARTGLSKSEQIRRGIRWWLESREWPVKTVMDDDDDSARPARPRSRRGGM